MKIQQFVIAIIIFLLIIGFAVVANKPLLELFETQSGGHHPTDEKVLDDTIRYNPDNFDLTYHDLNINAGLYETELKNIQVWDASSNHLITLPYAPAQNSPVYYDIDKRVYGPFHPTYEDTVLLGHYR